MNRIVTALARGLGRPLLELERQLIRKWVEKDRWQIDYILSIIPEKVTSLAYINSKLQRDQGKPLPIYSEPVNQHRSEAMNRFMNEHFPDSKPHRGVAMTRFFEEFGLTTDFLEVKE